MDGADHRALGLVVETTSFKRAYRDRYCGNEFKTWNALYYLSWSNRGNARARIISPDGSQIAGS